MRRLALGSVWLWMGVSVNLAAAQEPRPVPAVTLGPPVMLGAPIAASARLGIAELIKGGDHRLSTPPEIRRLESAIERLLARL